MCGRRLQITAAELWLNFSISSKRGVCDFFSFKIAPFQIFPFSGLHVCPMHLWHEWLHCFQRMYHNEEHRSQTLHCTTLCPLWWNSWKRSRFTDDVHMSGNCHVCQEKLRIGGYLFIYSVTGARQLCLRTEHNFPDSSLQSTLRTTVSFWGQIDTDIIWGFLIFPRFISW